MPSTLTVENARIFFRSVWPRARPAPISMVSRPAGISINSHTSVPPRCGESRAIR